MLRQSPVTKDTVFYIHRAIQLDSCRKRAWDWDPVAGSQWKIPRWIIVLCRFIGDRQVDFLCGIPRFLDFGVVNHQAWIKDRHGEESGTTWKGNETSDFTRSPAVVTGTPYECAVCLNRQRIPKHLDSASMEHSVWLFCGLRCNMGYMIMV